MRVLRWGGSLGLSKGPSVITRALIKETQKSQSQRLEDGSKERERGGGGEENNEVLGFKPKDLTGCTLGLLEGRTYL